MKNWHLQILDGQKLEVELEGVVEGVERAGHERVWLLDFFFEKKSSSQT